MLLPLAGSLYFGSKGITWMASRTQWWWFKMYGYRVMLYDFSSDRFSYTCIVCDIWMPGLVKNKGRVHKHGGQEMHLRGAEHIGLN